MLLPIVVTALFLNFPAGKKSMGYLGLQSLMVCLSLLGQTMKMSCESAPSLYGSRCQPLKKSFFWNWFIDARIQRLNQWPRLPLLSYYQGHVQGECKHCEWFEWIVSFCMKCWKHWERFANDGDSSWKSLYNLFTKEGSCLAHFHNILSKMRKNCTNICVCEVQFLRVSCWR